VRHCRRPADPEDAPRPGAALARATSAAAEGTGLTVIPISCLANCKRGLSAAMRRDGAWTYVFGDLDPDTGASALVAGARLLEGAGDGLMPWRGRPMRSSAASSRACRLSTSGDGMISPLARIPCTIVTGFLVPARRR